MNAASNSPLVTFLLTFGVSAAGTVVVYQCIRRLFPRKFKQLQRYFFTQIAMRYSARMIGRSLAPYKEKLFSHMKQSDVKILEIGIGLGANLSYYPPGAHLYSIEPNAYFEKYFRENVAKFASGVQVEKFIHGTAENMSSIEDASVDIVVSTHVLCSVDDVKRSLEQIVRVLVPGGKFYYIEHISYDTVNSSMYSYIQRIIEPIWQLFSDGCKLTRDPIRIMNSVTVDGYTLNPVIEDVELIDGVYTVMKPHVIGIREKSKEALR